MRVNRDMPKELLKKMFLNVLNEMTEENYYNCAETDFISIICQILTEQFQVAEFSENEFNEILQAVRELERDGFIEPFPGSVSNKFKVLTQKGKEYVQSSLVNFKMPDQEISKFIDRKDLKDLCLEDYLSGDYETAILKGFRLVEDIAKLKSAQPSKLIDREKLSGCYISPDGSLETSVDSCSIDADSLQRIMLGSMLWFKNPGEKNSHRDSQSAAQILLFINLHLNLIDQKKLLFNT